MSEDVKDEADREFWVFRRTDGHAITSARADVYDTTAMIEGEMWNPDIPRPLGTWTAETGEEWDANTRDCMRGVCAHAAPQRMRRGKVEPTPKREPLPRVHKAMPEEDWKAAMERVTLAMTAVTAVVAQVWEPMKALYASVVTTMHTVRIDAPHDQVCASETNSGTCFCACASCYEVADEEHPNICVCDFCGCKEDA